MLDTQHARAERLPSWHYGPVKQQLLEFIDAVTAPEGAKFVPAQERIAVFDNDGTLWCERPIPVQALFALDRVKDLAQKQPSIREKEPFKAVLEHDHDHDYAALAKLGKRGIVEILFATHSGMTPEVFDRTARRWLASARHPRFERPFTACAYQPMLELLEVLEDNDFTTFIVSGGGIDFMRALSDDTYGVPTHRVIGSSGKVRFEVDGQVDGQVASLIKLPELDTFDDGDAKPIDIHRHIGRRPIFAFGNSDGDLPMLRYTADQERPCMALLLHHDDAEREYAYDRDFSISPLDKGLDEAQERGWLVGMKDAFARVFPDATATKHRT